jgi:hypothetical protein
MVPWRSGRPHPPLVVPLPRAHLENARRRTLREAQPRGLNPRCDETRCGACLRARRAPQGRRALPRRRRERLRTALCVADSGLGRLGRRERASGDTPCTGCGGLGCADRRGGDEHAGQAVELIRGIGGHVLRLGGRVAGDGREGGARDARIRRYCLWEVRWIANGRKLFSVYL